VTKRSPKWALFNPARLSPYPCLNLKENVKNKKGELRKKSKFI